MNNGNEKEEDGGHGDDDDNDEEDDDDDDENDDEEDDDGGGGGMHICALFHQRSRGFSSTMPVFCANTHLRHCLFLSSPHSCIIYCTHTRAGVHGHAYWQFPFFSRATSSPTASLTKW